MFSKFLSLIYAAIISLFFYVNADAAEAQKVDVLMFTSPYCPHCQHMKREFLQDFVERNKDKITLHDFDTTTPDGSIAYEETAKLYGKSDEGVPAMFIGDEFLVGYPNDIGEKADKAVRKALEKGISTKMGAVKKLSAFKNVPDFMKMLPKVEENAKTPAAIAAPSVTLPASGGQPNDSAEDKPSEQPKNGNGAKNANPENVPAGEGVSGAPFTLPADGGAAADDGNKEFYRKKFSEITLWAIISAGLVDGINPCAFAVIIFFVSFLAVYKYDRNEIIAVGSAYCFAVFLTYLLLGLGLFRFLYAFQGFQMVMWAFKYLTIALCAVFFLLTLYDFIIYQKTKNADRVLLQLSKKNKERIHKVTRFFMRDKEKSLFRLICAAFVSGIIISLVEAVCTGQVYLPTIALMLKDTGSGHFFRALEYLLLYNLMFIVPLVAVLVLTIAGYEAKGFNAFLKKYLGLTKALLCLVFLALLVLLIMEM